MQRVPAWKKQELTANPAPLMARCYRCADRPLVENCAVHEGMAPPTLAERYGEVA